MVGYSKAMSQYWIKIIREGLDPFRTFVSDPALFRTLDGLAPATVLDAGCGEGYVSRYLAQRGHAVRGIDLSPELIEAAAASKVKDEQYCVGDVTALDLKNDSVDAVVSNFVLMGLSEPEKAVAETARVLRKGGHFIFQILHPFTYTSNDGRRIKMVREYFETESFAEGFVVGGVRSPEAAVRYHHPLGRYTTALTSSGFAIHALEEPRPIQQTPVDHPLHATFKDPWILLVEAVKL